MYSAHASCAICILTSDYFPRQQTHSYELKEIAKILVAAEYPTEDQSTVATAQAEGIHVARIDERRIYARSISFYQAKSRRLRQGKL
jgi:spore coat polysaccharide biosynthesis protein SpsF (cytidylyltransferase family)